MIDPKERTATFEVSFSLKDAVDYVAWVLFAAVAYGITWWFGNIDFFSALLIPFVALFVVSFAYFEVEWTTVEEIEG